MVITKIRPRSERGFTMAEILTVMTIVGVLAAIAIPLSLSSRSKGTEAAMTQDLNSVASSVQRLLSGWRGTPPAQIAITTTSGSWKAARGNTTDAGGPVATQGATVTGTVWTNGSYCVQASNGSTSLTYRSDTDAVTSGTCPAEELQGPGTITVAPAAGVPATPTGVLASSTVNNRVVVSWTAVAGATGYTVVVPNKAPSTTTTTTVTVDGVQPGAQTVSVRAFNSSGSGVPENVSVTVIGPQLYTNSTGNDFSGTVSARSNVNVTGAVAASSTMSVGGALTASSGLSVTGLTSLTGDLTGSGTSKLNQVFVGGGAISGTGGYATILGTNDFPFVVRPTDASGVAQGNSELYYSSASNLWRFEAPVRLDGNTSLQIAGAGTNGTLGGVDIRGTSDARWPVVFRPIGIDGVGIGTAEFYYNSTDDRWISETDVRVEKALTVVGATTVTGATALNGGLTSTTATLSGALTGLSANLSGTSKLNQIFVGGGAITGASGYAKIFGTDSYPFVAKPTNGSGVVQEDSDFYYSSASNNWRFEAPVRLDGNTNLRIGGAMHAGATQGGVDIVGTADSAWPVLFRPIGVDGQAIGSSEFYYSENGGAWISEARFLAASTVEVGHVAGLIYDGSGGGSLLHSASAEQIFSIRPVKTDGSIGSGWNFAYNDLYFNQTANKWMTGDFEATRSLTAPGASFSSSGVTLSQPLAGASASFTGNVTVRGSGAAGGGRLISSTTAASIFSIRPVKTDGSVGSGATTAYNDLYFNQTANEWVTGDLEVTRSFTAPGGVSFTSSGASFTSPTSVTDTFSAPGLVAAKNGDGTRTVTMNPATVIMSSDVIVTGLMSFDNNATRNEIDVLGDTKFIRDGSWSSPTFVNSWANYGSPYANAGYIKLPDGSIQLRGLVRYGTASTIFTLPTGYRPASTMLLPVLCNPNVTCRLTVSSTGAVTVSYANGGDNGYVSLEGIHFLASDAL